MLGECPAFGLPSIRTADLCLALSKVNADYLTAHGAAVQLTDETLADSPAHSSKIIVRFEKLALMRHRRGLPRQTGCGDRVGRVILASDTRR